MNLYFASLKTSTNPDILGISSLRFNHIKQVIQILNKVGEGEDITKYFEPTPEMISQAMEHVVFERGVPETDKRTRAR